MKTVENTHQAFTRRSRYIDNALTKAKQKVEAQQPILVDIYDQSRNRQGVRSRALLEPETHQVYIEKPQTLVDVPLVLHAWEFLIRVAQETQLDGLALHRLSSYLEPSDMTQKIQTRNVAPLRNLLTIIPPDIKIVVAHKEDTQVSAQKMIDRYVSHLLEISETAAIPFPVITHLSHYKGSPQPMELGEVHVVSPTPTQFHKKDRFRYQPLQSQHLTLDF